MDIETGLIEGVRLVASPNCDQRPHGVSPELLVIHGISLPPGEFGGPWIDRLFTNSLPPDVHPYFAEVADLRVSSHLLIRRQGELVQYVSFNQRAWHAGQSCFEGRDCCNDFSIGIELEGSDALAYTETQYEKLNALVATLLSTYPSLSADRIVGHSDIAPGRKTDPGVAFDWQRLRSAYLAGL
ncbi:MAG: 1,6-anhydro-N-acetylmuramyl-L-alanine amidase AmpD [Gammaproteobacteria bacterium]|nr:1,6-anhydro-N-acetylmuramyl-L-alanine amidase AmpD [Gammaproteobacteria bacterium]